MLENLQKCIDELLDCDAFELQLHMDENGQLNGYIPYMMNDALECFFVLTDCKLTGESVPVFLPMHPGILMHSAILHVIKKFLSSL